MQIARFGPLLLTQQLNTPKLAHNMYEVVLKIDKKLGVVTNYEISKGRK